MANWARRSGGGGGGDNTGVEAGDGIDVNTSAGPEPVVSVDVHADGGLTNRFDDSAAAGEGELGLYPGTAVNDVMVWRADSAVTGIDTIAATGALAAGTYTNVPTTATGGSGTGLTGFTITVADTAPTRLQL